MWKVKEKVQMSHKVIFFVFYTNIAPPQENAWEKWNAQTNCLIDFAFLFKGIRSIFTSLSLQTWLVRRNKNVDTLFQQMRNDKCINHSGSAA